VVLCDEHSLKQRNRALERSQLFGGEGLQLLGELPDPERAALLQEASSPRGRLEQDAPTVVRVGAAHHETMRLEIHHQAAHRRTPDVLGRGEPAEGARAAVDKDREGRQLRPAHLQGRVRSPKPAQEMDGRRVQVVGQLEDDPFPGI